MNNPSEDQNEELKQRRKADAMALAELIYDIYKDRNTEKQDGIADKNAYDEALLIGGLGGTDFS